MNYRQMRAYALYGIQPELQVFLFYFYLFYTYI